MVTVHHLENSRSQRILWLLEELGLEYEITKYARDPKTNLAPPELQKLHPLGKAPLVTDGDKTLAESGAIIEYLVDNYDDGRLRPADGTPLRLSYNYWLHYAEGTFMPLMILSLIISRIETAAVRTNLSDDYPNLAAYLQRMQVRPTYQAALERGGPYELLGGSTKK